MKGTIEEKKITERLRSFF